MANLQPNAPSGTTPPRRVLSLRVLIVTVLISAMMPFAYVGWRELYKRVLEVTPPELIVTQQPRGIGLIPVSITFETRDENSGLYEVVVRARQRSKVTELLRKKLHGAKHDLIEVALPGQDGSIEEGQLAVEIRVFDNAFWMNAAERDIVLPVDFRKPKIEVLSTQHNARHGGSQLLFYRVFDEDVAISGVKVGSKTFQGFPARGIDADLDDNSLFVVIYAIDLTTDRESVPVRVFAEDRVGNAISASFYNKVFSRSQRTHSVKIRDDFLRNTISGLAEAKIQEIGSSAKPGTEQIVFKNAPGTKQLLFEKFAFVNEKLRKVNDDELMSRFKGPRYDRYWESPFSMPHWTIISGFGSKANYTYEGETIGSSVQKGFEFLVPSATKEVFAANDGIVIVSDYMGTYGRLVAIDHGLGLATVYGHLESASVGQGERIARGQSIGLAGKSGFAQEVGFIYEMRVQGVAVDPGEWWDEKWFGAHITDKINDMKRALGLPVYRVVN